MGKLKATLARGEVTTFSRSSYEVVCSVFMIALAYFYRDNPQIVYPRILYFFVLLLGANFAFNRLLKTRASVSLWVLDLMLLANLWIITGVLYYSGGSASYFWVLYLLPVFAASLMASVKDAAGVVLLCALGLAVFNWPFSAMDLADFLSLAVKTAVLVFSAAVVFRTAQSRKAAEAGMAFKRAQVEKLEREVLAKESELVKTATAGEVGALVGGVMHDLGNSVSVILLSAQLMEEDSELKREDLARILKAARYSKSMISSAMGIVRGQEYSFEEFPLAEAAEGAALLTEYHARKRGAAVEVKVAPDLPQIRASRAHVERVLVNTLLNALSFAPDKGGRVTLSVRAEGGEAVIEVEDNGPGFPPELLAGGVKAFGTTRKEKGGTGLGLFVCGQVARRHDGTMVLANVPGGGALVTVRLPLAGPVN
jgi:signal transduction histidine kinase